MIAVVLFFTQFYWTPEEIELFITQFGPIGIVVYILLAAAFNVAAPLSGTPILLLGFSLFQQWAIWLYAIGNFIAMAINFWLARRYGRILIKKMVGQESMSKVDEISQDYGLVALFMVRLFMSGINDIASYAFGLTSIRFRPYIIISFIASLPPYLLFTLISSEDQGTLELLLLQLIIAGVLAGVYLASRFVWRRFVRLLLKGY